MKVLCPNCKKEIKWEETPTRPFCSERCRLIDLGEWAQEKYSVPDEHNQPTKDEQEEENED